MRKLISLILCCLLVLSCLSQSVLAAHSTDRDAETVSPERLDPKVERMLAWALETAADDTHGYSQRDRFGPNYDCASFVCTALMKGGFNLKDYTSPSGLLEQLPALGFRVYRRGEVVPQRGDILIQPYVHVEICMGFGCCVGAHQDYDWRSGDRTGHEIEFRTPNGSYCPFCQKEQYRWILRYDPLLAPVTLPESERIAPAAH